MSKISSRLARIEERLQPAGKGYQIFWTDDKETYYQENPRTGDPAPEQGYSRQDLEALEEDGWRLILVEYADPWPASQQDGLTG